MLPDSYTSKSRRTADLTIKLVDSLDRTITTISYPQGRVADAEYIGTQYRLRWNATASPDSFADGFYVWNECGDLITYA